MAGASNYPQSLDADANLIRVIAASAMTTADHNNLVDALESIEPSVGVMDSTLGGRVAERYTSPIAQQLGVASVAGRNPRYPYGAAAATDLYAVKGVLPTGWSASGTTTADFSSDEPYLRLTDTSSAYHAALAGTAVSAGAVGFICRVKASNSQPEFSLWPGFTYSGGTYPQGFQIVAGAGQVNFVFVINGVAASTNFPSASIYPPGRWLYFQVFYDGTHWSGAVSDDGVIWEWVALSVAGAAPLLKTVFFAQVAGAGSRSWIDFMQFGTVQVGA